MAQGLGIVLALVLAGQVPEGSERSREIAEARLDRCLNSVFEEFEDASPRLARVLCIKTLEANDLRDVLDGATQPCPVCPPPTQLDEHKQWKFAAALTFMLLFGVFAGVMVR